MGLKDLFGGGKKKDELVEKAKEVVSQDGKLTPHTTAKLKAFAEENAADLADDKTKMRRDIYNAPWAWEVAGSLRLRGRDSPYSDFSSSRDDRRERPSGISRASPVTDSS